MHIGNGDWTLWRHCLVRGAGFPVQGLLRLADKRLAATADALDEHGGDAFARSWEDQLRSRELILGEIASSDRFRLAVTWQNPRMMETCIEPLLRQVRDGEPRNHRRRQRERVVAMYWQRYCAKNETIGFFGPVTWGEVSGPGTPAAVRVGGRMVDQADIYLESWAVDVLAAQLDADFALGPWLRPRRAPFLQLTQDSLILPSGKISPVDPLTAAILARADGSLLARDLVAAIQADFRDVPEQTIYEALSAMRRRRWLIWKLEVPAAVRGEDELRQVLSRIDEDELRHRTVDRVDRLRAARDLVRRSWDDPDQLRQELLRLEEIFEELTGHSGTRNHGRTYGSRTLAYLECRRGVSVRLGGAFTAALEPLSLILDSIRWLTWRIRQAVEPEVHQAYQRIADRRGPGPNAAMLWAACMPMLDSKLEELVKAAVAEFHDRWRAVLAYDEEASRAEYALSDLRPAVLDAFDAPRSGWSEARWCSPDVMIAASGPGDVRAGRFTLVLGEVHAAMNTLDYWSAVLHHPDPAELFRSVDHDFPQPRMLTALPKESPPRFTARSHPGLGRSGDYRIAVLPHTPLPVREKAILAGDTAVVEQGGHLFLRVGDAEQFDVLDLLAEAIKGPLLRNLELFPGRHKPRLTVGNFVLARESWTFAAKDLEFARHRDEAGRFVAARRWALSRGLPRHVFVKSPVEVKPFYVDFASPVYVDLLVSAAHRVGREARETQVSELKMTEMLPTPAEAWLSDAEGNRYTSEIRLLAVDAKR